MKEQDGSSRALIPAGVLSPQSLQGCSSPPPGKLWPIHFVLVGKWLRVKRRVPGKALCERSAVQWEQHEALVGLCRSSPAVHWLRNSRTDQPAAQHLPRALQPCGTAGLQCQKARSLLKGTGQPRCLSTLADCSRGGRLSSARHLDGTGFISKHSNLGRISTPHGITSPQRGNITS